MANERNQTSVIAQLMSFDDVPYQQQSLYRRQRVLSENYIRNSASIGSCKRRSSKLRQKDRSKNDGRSLGSVKQPSKALFLADSRASIGWEFKKNLLEKSKKTKGCRDIWSSKGVCNLAEMPNFVDLELKQRLELGTRVNLSSNEGWKNKSVTKLPIFKRSTKLKKVPKGDLRLTSGRHNKNVSTKFEDVVYSCESAVSFEKESPCEDGFTSLNCVNIDDELSNSSGEAYQPSPNSVLEPDNLSSSDLHGLWIKLQILKSESEENGLESETVTLSDENATEKCFYVGQNNKPIRFFGPKESQQFLYLVDVLNELGFHGNKMEVSYEKCIINPFIFETLEKKYNKQKSWNKVDRRLLFDRLNLGLTEIVRSKPLRRKMSKFLRRDIIEEELWNMLLGQENEINADLSEKSIGKEPWLELGDEVDSIVEEIEAFLFNEFVTELVAN
ncbi:DUF3741-associated sequence motif protein [Tanacetum coccineum]